MIVTETQYYDKDTLGTWNYSVSSTHMIMNNYMYNNYCIMWHT